uniref:Uncharacterized protein n=1 Tax=Siphoviridae sp. ctWhx86 TaxID=2826362 RepID=A0A8S5QQD0_9CAUD|nr:MAG TPA: hypothetical protein [Siphoviridae sp. ctWhx86]
MRHRQQQLIDTTLVRKTLRLLNGMIKTSRRLRIIIMQRLNSMISSLNI